MSASRGASSSTSRVPSDIEVIRAGIDQLRRLVEQSTRAVVFTGAGISTESGIPDFRSPGGVWTKNQPILFQDFLASAEMRRETWRRKIETDKVLLKAEPNRGHRAVEKLFRRGKVASVITQNIDGLHQASGIPDDKVIELHGNTTYAKCLDCETRYELEEMKAEFAATGDAPSCARCSGLVKPATISFGQAMPEEAMERAQEESLAADLFIAVGSSLVVYPAAGFPLMAKQNGAALVILNREPTAMDRAADLTLNAEIGPVLGEVAGVN